MTTTSQHKLNALAGVSYDMQEMATGGPAWSQRSSKRWEKRKTHRKVRHTLKAQLLKETEDDLAAEFAAELAIRKIQRMSGIGAKCVLIRNGRVHVQ